MTRALLATADGDVFEGRSVGADGIATGEVVFNTAMAGYQEIATDPSYAGQVVVMTAPQIGNYGVNDEDSQAPAPHCVAMVVRAMARRDSNWRSQGSFADYLADHGVIAISDVDTRRLTRLVRQRGAMPVAIGTDVDAADLIEEAQRAPGMEGQDLVSGVTTGAPYVVEPVGPARGQVIAYDFGIKRDILRRLTERGLQVTVVPASTPAAEVMAQSPAGVFLSNGPGDPEPVRAGIEAVRDLLGRVPLFGICLGHQILGLALGARSFKLPFGHHGGNHPVRRLADGRVEITAQNHGFAVDLWSLAGTAPPPPPQGIPGPEQVPAEVTTDHGVVRATHMNLNDGTLEGLEVPEAKAFSVQYHPEAAPGPHDAVGLFDRFVTMMGVA